MSKLPKSFKLLTLVLFLLPQILFGQDVLPPNFSSGSGIFETAIQLELSAPPGVQIYYTTDGRNPTESGSYYSGPIDVNTSMTIRAVALKNGVGYSEVKTQVFLVGVNHSLPIVFLAFEPDDFFAYGTGMYTNFWLDLEAPADITLFEPDGTLAFEQPAKVEIQGSSSAAFAHKSLKIKAKKFNGKKLFDYPIFPDRPHDAYGSFVLRNSGQDWNLTHFRDAYATSFVDDLSDVGNLIDEPDMILQGYRPAIAYFNGEYRGIYNIRERYDKRYFKAYYGWKKKDYELIKNEKEVKSGSIDNWNQYMDFLLQNDMSITANFDSLKKMMDVDAFIDYMAFNIYINNHDWPGNNVRRFREKSPNGKWRWMVYDLDYSLSLYNDGGAWNSGGYWDNALNRMYGTGWNWPNQEWATRPFRACAQNKEWRTKFINRMADQLNVLYNSERLQNRLADFASAYESEIEAHHCKWFECWNKWDSDVTKVGTFVDGRAPVVRQHFVQQYQEVTGTTTVTISATPLEGGQVEFSTINLSEEKYPWSGTYFAGVDIPVVATPASGYEFVGWSDPSLGTAATTDVKLTNGTYNLVAQFELIDLGELSISCPENIMTTTPTDSAIVSWELPSVSTTCPNGSDITLTLVSDLVSDSKFPIGESIVEYSSVDACGNTATCSFVVMVEPVLSMTCPENITVTTVTDSAMVEWDLPLVTTTCAVGSEVEITSNKESGSDFPKGITAVSYSVVDSCENTATCTFSILVEPEPTTLSINCPENISMIISTDSVLVEWAMPSSKTTCMISQDIELTLTGDMPSGSKFPIGETTVEYAGLDSCDNTGTCSFMVVIEAEENSVLSLNCPENITLTTPTNYAIGTWEQPMNSTTCEISSDVVLTLTNALGSGSDFPIGESIVEYLALDSCDNTATCSFTVTVEEEAIVIEECVDVPGYEKLGELDGHTYFLSENSSMWNDIMTPDLLLSIGSQAENDYVQNMINVPVFMGLNDAAEEGNLVWSDGSPLTYTNYANCSWCGMNNGDSDYGTLFSWDGTWGFANQWVRRQHVIERVCTTTGVDETCPESIAGFNYLGTYGGHNYFMSNDIYNWVDAESLAFSKGGFLATLNTQEENNFVKDQLGTEMVFVGLNDAQNEGVYQWSNGDPVTLNLVEANNEQGDYAVMNFWAGTWEMNNKYVQKRFIMEVDCVNYGEETTPNTDGYIGVVFKSLYPNPSHDFVNLVLSSNTDESVEFTIRTPQGELISSRMKVLTYGVSELTFDIHSLNAGVYYLQASGSNVAQIMRFVKISL